MLNHTNYLLRVCCLCAGAGLLLFCMNPTLRADNSDGGVPVVLATIKPLHSLAAVVTDGVSEPRLLIDGNMSPHLFQLKPSHIKAVEQADIVLWAGEGVERFIPSLLKKFAADAIEIELAALTGVTTHKSRSSQAESFSERHSDDDHDHSDIDYHLWLEPRNAAILVDELARQLTVLDPVNGDKYLANAINFKRKLESQVAEVQEILSDVQGQSYLIYHDSLQYFEKAYGLGEAIVVTSQPQMQAGAKRLKAIRSKVVSARPGCIFSEPQFRSPALKALATDLHLRSETVDPLASDFEAGASLYTDWMKHTAETIAICLSHAENN